MAILQFTFTLILAMAATSIFFSFVSYGVSMFAFLLFVLPMMGLMIGGFKIYKLFNKEKGGKQNEKGRIHRPHLRRTP